MSTKRYQFVRAPHVAERLQQAGCTKVKAELPSAYCAVFELNREELALFHALCKGQNWYPSKESARIKTRAHGYLDYSFTWSPYEIPGGVKTPKGYIKWEIVSEDGLSIELPRSFNLSSRVTINSLRDVEKGIIRYHSRSRLESIDGTPTGAWSDKLTSVGISTGLHILPSNDHPYALLMRVVSTC